MGLTRKNKKQTSSQRAYLVGRQYLLCSECNNEEVEVPADIGKVVCSYCVQKLIQPPTSKIEKSDKPRGWHLKHFFEHEGKVYSKGKEVTDSNKIIELKNNISLR